MKRSLLPFILLLPGLLLVIGGGHHLGVRAGESAAAILPRHTEPPPLPPPKPAPWGQPTAVASRAQRGREDMIRLLASLPDKGLRNQFDADGVTMGFDAKALDPFLDDLSDEEFQLALELVPQIAAPFGQTVLRLALGRHWMKKDVAAGWEYLQKNPPTGGPFVDAWNGISMQELVDINPGFAASELVAEAQRAKDAAAPGENARSLEYVKALWSLFKQLSETDLPQAFSTAAELSRGDRQLAMGQVARGSLDERREAFVEEIDKVRDPALRFEWQKAAVVALGVKDSGAARQWLESLDLAPEPAAQLARDLFGAWAHREPEAALDWAKSRFPENEQPALLADMVRNWALHEPNVCGRWLGEQPAGSLTDPARDAFARSIAGKDPDSARAWAGTISDPVLRERCLADLPAKQ